MVEIKLPFGAGSIDSNVDKLITRVGQSPRWFADKVKDAVWVVSHPFKASKLSEVRQLARLRDNYGTNEGLAGTRSLREFSHVQKQEGNTTNK